MGQPTRDHLETAVHPHFGAPWRKSRRIEAGCDADRKSCALHRQATGRPAASRLAGQRRATVSYDFPARLTQLFSELAWIYTDELLGTPRALVNAGLRRQRIDLEVAAPDLDQTAACTTSTVRDPRQTATGRLALLAGRQLNRLAAPPGALAPSHAWLFSHEPLRMPRAPGFLTSHAGTGLWTMRRGAIDKPRGGGHRLPSTGDRRPANAQTAARLASEAQPTTAAERQSGNGPRSAWTTHGPSLRYGHFPILRESVPL